MKGRISDKERARRRLRWANRKRKLAGLPSLLDSHKAKLRAIRKARKRRAAGSGVRRRIEKSDGRWGWVKKRKAAGTWLPPARYSEAKALEEKGPFERDNAELFQGLSGYAPSSEKNPQQPQIVRYGCQMKEGKPLSDLVPTLTPLQIRLSFKPPSSVTRKR